MSQHLSLSTTILAVPRRAALCAGKDNLAEVLVRIQAPDAPAGHVAERAPQALALVIDRSGSMEGRPLDEAKRCAEYVLGKLRPTDAVALVKFDNRVQRLWPAAPLGDGQALRAAIAGIHAGGSTNLQGGWQDGAEALAAAAGSGLKRVILLSDGEANAGMTDPDAISQQCATLANQGITTSTYGLGHKFNEDLMVAMAQAGGGNHYYGDTAEDLMEPFQQELELLENLCLREVKISATAPDGLAVECLNQLPTAGDGWSLPDLAWGAEAWVVLRVRVPVAALPPNGRTMPVLRISVEARSLDGEPVQLERTGLALPVLSATEFDTLPQDELVCRRLAELEAAEVMTQMREAARRGDWSDVDRLLADASQRFSGNTWLAAILSAMQGIAQSRDRERICKEAMYSSRKLHNRLASKDEPDGLTAHESSELPAFLRRKPAQGKGDL